MAEYISVSKISNYVGQEVTVKGWKANGSTFGKVPSKKQTIFDTSCPC